MHAIESETESNSGLHTRTKKISFLLFRIIITCAGVFLVLDYFAFQVWAPWRLERSTHAYKKTYKTMLDISNALDACDDLDNNAFFLKEKDIMSRAIDPYTDAPLTYVIKKGSKPRLWYLISSGPDKLVSFDAKAFSWIPYDPTNGLVSSGDIVFGSYFNPKRFDVGPLPQELGRLKGNPQQNPETWQRAFEGYAYAGNR